MTEVTDELTITVTDRAYADVPFFNAIEEAE